MKTPSEFELDQLLHAAVYDPAKAHEYYLKNRDLKGRKKAAPELPAGVRPAAARAFKKHPLKEAKNPQDPRTGKTRKVISKNARAKQKVELTKAIAGLQERLHKLEALIKERTHDQAAENRKSKAKKERSAKEKDKPATAAEKRKQARDSEKYRDKHKQELKNKDKKDSSKSGGSSSKDSKSSSKHSVEDLRSLATKVRGQIAVAKQKLAAL